MRKLSLLICLALIYLTTGCGKKEPAPAPQPQEQAQVEQPAPEPVPEPEPEPEPEPKPEPQKEIVAIPGTFTVQVAAWETRTEAEKLAGFYNGKGYDSRVEEADLSSGRWYRVRIGTYDNSVKAGKVADEIAEKYKSDIWIVKL
jgi:cell division protein FtsN